MRISNRWKNSLAQLVQWPIVQRFMAMGIRAIVPKHRIGIAVVVLDDQNRVLMLEHVFHAYAPWGLPGGWLDAGESPGAGALRELYEETGLTACLGPCVHVARQKYPDSVNMAFVARDVSGTLELSKEIIDARWFTQESLPAPLFPFTRRAIIMALELQAEKRALQSPEPELQ